MKKKDLFLSYLFVVPTVFLVYFFHISFWQWIAIIIFMFVYPIVFGLLNKTNTPIWLTTLIPFLFIMTLFIGYCIGLNDYIKIATTDDIKKAEEIEDIISTHWYNTIRFIDGRKYTIALRNANKNSYKEIVLYLIMNDVVTENVFIHLDINSVAFSKKGYISNLVKNLKKELQFLINDIDGVYNSTVDIEFSSCFFDMDCGNPYIKANIKIDTDESFETEIIKELAEKLLLATIRGLTKDNIKIEFNIKPCSKQDKCYNHQTTERLYKQAKFYYNKKNYIKTLKYLEKAYKIDPSYITSFNDVMKVMELDEAIKKTPNDYKLYIQRGDMKNVFEYSMFVGSGESIISDYYGAIDDYTKALTLNPKAYEVYEKRGDAWAECGYKRCIGCRLERTRTEDKNAIKDYENAIKYIGGNDKLYEKLGDRYINDNPQKALEYFNKVKDIHYADNDEVMLPIFTDELFPRTYYQLPLKIAQCYAELGKFDEALSVLDEFIVKSNNNELIQHANNMKFYYNWKAKRYKRALKSADNCSVWVCKALGIFF